jgi:uncharacterized protein YbbC (DUF1343 family)
MVGQGMVSAAVAAVAAPLLSATPARSDPELLLTGLERLTGDQASLLNGKRIALLTHAAAIDGQGVRSVDRLAASSHARLSLLLSPEHGLDSRAAAGAPVGHGTDAATGLPVHSLYGPSRAPDPGLFDGIDAVVVDLQDCGARPFTYSSTLAALLRVAAQTRTQIIVTDRPNPLGGVQMEGPMLDPALASFVGAHDVPLRHGLTFGELAGMINREAGIGADLHIVPMRGWKRDDGFEPFLAGHLPFFPPSPNLRSPSAVTTYPGTVLIEGTNISEGRGTDRPFETIGAPFIKSEQLVTALLESGLGGIGFDPVEFTPDTSKFAGQMCQGVSLWASESVSFLPVRTGLTILATLLRLYPDQTHFLSGNPPFFDRLIGQAWVRPALLDGTAVATIEAQWQDGLARFAERRTPFLLY